ncbi:hypothetical protein AMK16_19160 [Streptomyces sp. CB00455]|uniref:hypothetical protein n=1 Tax=Streptomyces sp. CB00455 TaxID=1703927 RepID=UPI00093ACEBE|nr:hypothetical protein [Streptomyces sp. CB00455]OKK18422.1 hypothetical protein AMK16_19160 [Streptomyces sp. CB00455]
MHLTKRFVAISTAATAAVLFSAGGAQAQENGEFLSFLGNTTLLRVSYPVQVGNDNTYTGPQNTNTNNNTGGGTNNNNNNNGAGGLQQDVAGLYSRSTALMQVSHPVQVGNGNTYTGPQNTNTNNNTGGGTNNNNNNNGGVNNNNNNNNLGGGVNNNNNNNNNIGSGSGIDKGNQMRKTARLQDGAAMQSCYPMTRLAQDIAVIEHLNIDCDQH